MSCKWKQESVYLKVVKLTFTVLLNHTEISPFPVKNTDHISLWISVQIYPHLSLKLRQTKNLRFRSSPEIGLKSHGNLALKWLKTWELRRKIDEVEGSQSKVRVRLKRPPSATYMSLIWFGRWWKPTVLWLNCHLFSYCYSLQFICNFATLVRPINFYNEPFVILNFDPRPSSNNAGDPILSLTGWERELFSSILSTYILISWIIGSINNGMIVFINILHIS